MKKELFYYSILVLVIAGLLLSETSILDAKSEYSSKIIDITSFDKLDIDLACNFYVAIGEEQKVVFEGPSKYLDLLETRMENGILKITSKNAGALSDFFNTKGSIEECVNVYINLTSADQLVIPTKGNLVTREASLYQACENTTLNALNQSFKGILKLFGTQLGYIKVL